jgi:hypothetical protein
MLATILRDPVPYHGALGLFATITIERLNALVGLLVGVTTLVYLCLRIRNEWRARNRPPPTD